MSEITAFERSRPYKQLREDHDLLRQNQAILSENQEVLQKLSNSVRDMVGSVRAVVTEVRSIADEARSTIADARSRIIKAANRIEEAIDHLLWIKKAVDFIHYVVGLVKKYVIDPIVTAAKDLGINPVAVFRMIATAVKYIYDAVKLIKEKIVGGGIPFIPGI